MMSSEEANQPWLTRDRQALMPTVTRLPLAIQRGEGHFLMDMAGKRYLDLTAGLGVNVVGYRHPRLQAALHKQLDCYWHISNLFACPPAIRLAEKLLAIAFPQHGGKVFFTNSGTEATEVALKLIHRFYCQSSSPAPHPFHFAVLAGAFHGRTAGAFSLAPHPQAGYYPALPFQIHSLTPEDFAQATELFRTQRLQALFLEPVLGSGGVISLSPSYMRHLASLAQKHHTILVLDEIQTGIGRTGEFFAYQHASLTPDLILFGKGVGGGLPLGGILARGPYGDVLQRCDN